MIDGTRPVGQPPADTTIAPKEPANAHPAITPPPPTPPTLKDGATTSASGKASAKVSLLDSAPEKKGPKPVTERKGQFFASWGYNRAYYGKSTIHFENPGKYDFYLNNVSASDRPSFKSTGDFIKGVWKEDLTIPQYNFRMGYFINDRTSISLGADHMKYVMDKNQMTTMTGTIDKDFSPEHGVEDAQNLPVMAGNGGNAVAHFEHTDGFNLIDVEVGHWVPISQSQNGKHAVSFFGTVGAGAIVPKSNVTIFDKQLDNKFHLAGYGLSGSAGVRADLFRHFYVEGKLKAGYVDVMNALTVEGGKAQHTVAYLQPSLSIGMSLGGNKK